jgi:hypothetical protein
MLCKAQIFLFLLFLSLNQSFSQVKKEDPKNILILFSMNQGLVAYQLILENFKDVLQEEYGKSHKIFVEYLDVGKFPDFNYQQFLFDGINSKYKNTHLNLMVCVGPSIIPLISKYAAPYLKEIPTISLDFRDPFDPNKYYSINSITTEILVDLDAKCNFELAFKLFPN